MPSVFFSYSHADEALRDQLEKQLSVLKRQGLISTWHDRRIGPGSDFAREIDEHVEKDNVILLLVSPDFLDSDYCYDKEMLRALERHEAGEAVVLPVILRPCEWTHAPFGKLLATPTDGKPITKFADRDEGFLEVARAIRSVVEKSGELSSASAPERARSAAAPARVRAVAAPAHSGRSSNLVVAKSFSQKDRDTFKDECFEYIAAYFENSLTELNRRNDGIEFAFRRIDANRFSAVIYRDGESVSRATVFVGSASGFADGIAYSNDETLGSNSYNDLLQVRSDDESVFVESNGFGMSGRAGKLTMEGAAEHFWSRFVAPIQPRDRGR